MNKLVKCKSCGREIAKSAKCPGCGRDNRNFFMKHKILTGIMVIGIIGTIGASGSDEITKVDGEKPVASGQQDETRNFNVGDIAEKKDSYKISVNKISEYKSKNEFMKAQDGKKHVVANITIENLSADRDITVSSMMCFNLLSVDGVKYDIAITDAGSQLDGTVAPGRKLTGNIAYEVPKDLSEAELEVNLDIFTGKAIYFKGEIN